MKCPKCGGSTGFEYHLTLKTNRRGDWGEDDDEETECGRTYEPRTVICQDCGKRTEWNKAHGFPILPS
jgi:hypothetical protein